MADPGDVKAAINKLRERQEYYGREQQNLNKLLADIMVLIRRMAEDIKTIRGLR